MLIKQTDNNNGYGEDKEGEAFSLSIWILFNKGYFNTLRRNRRI